MHEKWLDRMVAVIQEMPEYRYALFAEGDEDNAGGGGESDAGNVSDGEGKAADKNGEGGDAGEGAPEADDWRAPIQDTDLRKVADRFASASDMAKAVVDLRKRESTSIRIPGKKASDEDRAAYSKAIGVPETVEGYEFSTPEGEELTEADTAFRTWAGETFHGLNISQDQAKGLDKAWNEYAAQVKQAQIDADTKFADESEAALKVEWPGAEFDRNKQHANAAATKVFGDEIDEVRNIETKDGRFILDHPVFVKMLAQIGREMSEGTLGGVMSEGDQNAVETQIAEMEKKIDKAKAEGDRSAANRLYREQQELYRKRYGGGAIVGSEGRAA